MALGYIYIYIGMLKSLTSPAFIIVLYHFLKDMNKDEVSKQRTPSLRVALAKLIVQECGRPIRGQIDLQSFRRRIH